ncbi:MAG TPA: hypothetical protein VJ820_05975 [Propionibacteriaceae bacterium]|nr:hypothetical protein [Propionibacteriaceae bacterium]
MRNLVGDVSAATEKPMAKEALDLIFKGMWPSLEVAVHEALEGAPLAQEPQRSEKDMVAEVVDTVRRIERHGRPTVPAYEAFSDPNVRREQRPWAEPRSTTPPLRPDTASPSGEIRRRMAGS